MQETQILSTLPGDPPTTAFTARSSVPAGRALVFDACHAGVVLRAVMFVEVVLAVGVLYGAENLPDWVARLALLTGVALPATLAWLVAACSLKQVLQRLPTTGQYLAGVLLGALAGAGACGMPKCSLPRASLALRTGPTSSAAWRKSRRKSSPASSSGSWTWKMCT